MDVLKPDIIRIESRRYRAVCCVDRQPVETGEETYIEDGELLFVGLFVWLFIIYDSGNYFTMVCCRTEKE